MVKKVVPEHIDGRELLKNPLEAEYRAFRKMLPRLLKKYKDEYVAIYQGKLLGHHADDREMARRAYDKVGNVAFLLTKVSKTRPVEELSSPEEFTSLNSGGENMSKRFATKARHIRGIPEDPSEAEFRAFRKMLPRLLRRYEGEYVAIYKGKVVGHHADFSELGRRTFEKLGDVPFIMPKVSRKWPETVELSSPE
jgi:uncharacterized Fe-S cluster protein YjdI